MQAMLLSLQLGEPEDIVAELEGVAVSAQPTVPDNATTAAQNGGGL
jgi:hypothetical protein